MTNKLGYLFSLLVFPILVSKYSFKDLGTVFTIQAIVLGIASLANYGFTYYLPIVTNSIARNSNKLIKTWQLVVFVRMFFSIAYGILSFGFVSYFFPVYLKIWMLSLPILLPKTLSPILFCNALEKNSIVFRIGFVNKLLFLIFIYFSNSIYHVNLSFAIAEFLAIIFFIKKIHFGLTSMRVKISYKYVVSFLKSTLNLFAVNVISFLKPVSILPLISFFLGNEYAALYAMAEKVPNILKNISGSAFTGFYPIYAKENIAFRGIADKRLLQVLFFALLITVSVWICSPYFIFILNNFNYNDDATMVLRVLSLSIPVFFLIIPFFTVVLGKKKYSHILFFAVVQLVVFTAMISFFHTTLFQFALAFILAEYAMLLGYYCYIAKNY